MSVGVGTGGGGGSAVIIQPRSAQLSLAITDPKSYEQEYTNSTVHFVQMHSNLNYTS